MLPFWRDGKAVILRAETESFTCSGVALLCLKGRTKPPKTVPAVMDGRGKQLSATD